MKEIDGLTDGAKFVRADLHIHSFGPKGSYDVKDNQMTPENIVNLAIKEGLSIISITDHNEVGNVEDALKHSEGKSLLVIPGIELSTTDGHLLIYMPNVAVLQQLVGKLNISMDKKTCNNTIVQCLDFAHLLGGFGVAAHIDLDNGFEMYMKGYTPFKEAVVRHHSLLGLEVSRGANSTWFSDSDTDANRRKLIHSRRAALSEDNTYELAKVMSSDSHVLEALGKNASGNKKLTRLKVDSLNFHSFKIAFLDPSARIRIEDFIPSSVPFIKGAKFNGGFLSGQAIKFNRNLTCIIGGRGAGKSTVMESVRACSGNGARPNLIDNEVWPERIELLYEDETGREQIFTKDKLRQVINSTDPEEGMTQIKIESFGQGETAETIQHSDKDRSVLTKFFDSFIDFETLKADDQRICQQLLDNQTSIERALIEVNTIPQIEKAKKSADEQVKLLKAKDAKKAVELEEGLANERTLRDELVKHLQNLVNNISQSLSDKKVFDLVSRFKEDRIIIGKDEFKEVKSIVNNFSKAIDGHSTDIKKDSAKVNAEIMAQLKTWKDKEKKSQDQIEEIRKEIEAKGGKLDIGFIRKITKDSSDYELRLSQLSGKKGELEKLRATRIDLLKARREIKNKIYRKRFEFTYKVNSNLKSTVVDFQIDIVLKEGLYSPTLATLIKDTMGWRTAQVPKADLIVENIHCFNLLEILRKGNASAIRDLKGPEGGEVFTKIEAEQIIRNLNAPQVLGQIERCEFDDVVEVTLTRSHLDESGKEIFVKRTFGKLSLGQQQSILLAVLLFSDRNCPLLIDQPEDNLDSEFIYKTIVKNLRRVKELRQVIIVTHNANIAVLGDAELIVPLKSTNEKTHIIDRGSIDSTATKKITCAILEGGEKAFMKRKEIYGL